MEQMRKYKLPIEWVRHLETRLTTFSRLIGFGDELDGIEQLTPEEK